MNEKIKLKGSKCRRYGYICLMLSKKFKYALVLFALIVVAGVNAQVPDPPGGGAPPCGEPFGTVCPIDGGVSFLIAAGVALGGKKAYELRKKSMKNK